MEQYNKKNYIVFTQKAFRNTILHSDKNCCSWAKEVKLSRKELHEYFGHVDDHFHIVRNFKSMICERCQQIVLPSIITLAISFVESSANLALQGLSGTELKNIYKKADALFMEITQTKAMQRANSLNALEVNLLVLLLENLQAISSICEVKLKSTMQDDFLKKDALVKLLTRHPDAKKYKQILDQWDEIFVVFEEVVRLCSILKNANLKNNLINALKESCIDSSKKKQQIVISTIMQLLLKAHESPYDISTAGKEAEALHNAYLVWLEAILKKNNNTYYLTHLSTSQLQDDFMEVCAVAYSIKTDGYHSLCLLPETIMRWFLEKENADDFYSKKLQRKPSELELETIQAFASFTPEETFYDLENILRATKSLKE